VQHRGADARRRSRTCRSKSGAAWARSPGTAAGADIILLDNLSADIIDAVNGAADAQRPEISGGVTLARIPELAATGAYTSIGAHAFHRPPTSASRWGSDPMTLPDDLATALTMAGDRLRIFTGQVLWFAESDRPMTSPPRSRIAVSQKAPS
jgi:hypothetical protein